MCWKTACVPHNELSCSGFVCLPLLHVTVFPLASNFRDASLVRQPYLYRGRPTLRVTSWPDAYTISLTAESEALPGVIKCYGLDSSDATGIISIGLSVLDGRGLCEATVRSRFCPTVKHSDIMLLLATSPNGCSPFRQNARHCKSGRTVDNLC